jgi:hypothetical protein
VSEHTLPQQEIRRRLNQLIEDGKSIKPFERTREVKDLRLADVARYIGRGKTTLVRIAHGQDMTPQDQLHLSRLFAAWDQGRLTKFIPPEGNPELRWVRGLRPGTSPVSGMRIEIGQDGPKLTRD